MKTTALICGSEEEKQIVNVYFEYRHFRKFWGEESTIFVSYCKIIDPLKFKPTDLDGDLSISIAEALWEHPNDIKFECEIKHSVKSLAVITIQHTYDNLILFI